jgi:hypothetical protein
MQTPLRKTSKMGRIRSKLTSGIVGSLHGSTSAASTGIF